MAKGKKMQEEENRGEYVDFDGQNQTKREGFWPKIETFLGSRYFFVLIIILVAIIAYCLGRISNSNPDREPVRVFTSDEVRARPLTPERSDGGQGEVSGEVKGAADSLEPQSTSVVASKNGTKYHYPWCPGAKQIAEKNLITFASPEAARSQGYTPASNCKGLK